MAELGYGNGHIGIANEGDIVTVRKTVRDKAGLLGFNPIDVTRIVTAASELARNIVRYAGSGLMNWRVIEIGDRLGLELSFEDQGPGIEDLEQALEPGFTTSGGLGLGLPGAKRLMDEMEIKSQKGRGTRVMIRKWFRRDIVKPLRVDTANKERVQRFRKAG